MKINSLLLLLTLTACQAPLQEQQPSSVSGPRADKPVTLPLTGDPTPSPVPTAPITKRESHVSIHQANNFNSEQLALLEKARIILERVVNSEDFKEKVLTFTYAGQKAFVQNDGLTNSEIYERIIDGAEQLPAPSSANQTIDVYLELYTSSWFGRNTLGYTYPTTSTVFTNTYFYNYASAGEIAGNIMHEWLHKLGFDHDSNSTARRPYSVPYAIGDIAEALAKQLE